MKLSHLYSNQPALFAPIRFRDGLNVILGNIQHPKDQKKIGHNLGKTLLTQIVDFGLLKGGIDKHHRFKRRADLFSPFIFFLEIQLPSGGFVTIRRAADEATKIAFKRHSEPHQDYSETTEDAWDHWCVTLKKAVTLLDGWLAFTPVKPWSFRKGLSYFLRTQDDYGDVFQLAKHIGQHTHWKPYLARVLGFDDQVLTSKYEADSELKKLQAEQAELQAEVTLKPSDFEKLRASIAVTRDEVNTKVHALDGFDFQGQEVAMARDLAESTEVEIANNNEFLYNARHDLTQIERSLADEVHFDLADVQRVFNEAQLTFPNQLAKDYSDLVEFNRRILTERRSHLTNQAATLRDEIASLAKQNTFLSAKRRDILKVLGGTDSLQKFKDLQRQLDQDRAQLALLETKAAKLEEIIALQTRARLTKTKVEETTAALQDMVHAGNPRYQEIQLTFSRIVTEVLHRTALLYLEQNGEGNLDFHAEFSDTTTDLHTDEDRGTTFRQLLCIAFDLAVLISYARDSFFHFVYHDGGLERLQNKLKLSLLQVIRDTCAHHGIQYLLSALSEDLPTTEDPTHLCPTPEEIILTLHDGGDQGRLFKMVTF
jgi:uncharacterized protein YydD (DUF2326 family)